MPAFEVYCWDGSAPSGRRLRDISMTGGYLVTDERWYLGTLVRLLIQAPSGSVSIPARVVWHGEDGMGFEFLFPTSDDRNRLAVMLADRAGRGVRCAQTGKEASAAPAPGVRQAGVQRGQSLVEFILILPLVLLLIVNTVNFGAFFFAWITVANAARAGAQYWSLGTAGVGTPSSPTSGQVTSLLTTDVSSLLNRASLTVRLCTNSNGAVSCSGSGTYTPPADPEPANDVLVSVDVTYTYQPPIPLWNFPAVGVFATLPSTNVHRRTIMRRLQ